MCIYIFQGKVGDTYILADSFLTLLRAQFMRVKNVVVEKNLIPILHVYEEQKVKQCECSVETFHLLLFY